MWSLLELNFVPLRWVDDICDLYVGRLLVGCYDIDPIILHRDRLHVRCSVHIASADHEPCILWLCFAHWVSTVSRGALALSAFPLR